MRVGLGQSRILHDRFTGFNTPLMWDIPFEDPKAGPLFANLRAGLFRFPGGLIANHWDWRSGRVAVPDTFPGSFRAGAQDAIRLHPQGSSAEDFAVFAAECGAEFNLVLNIQSTTVEDQVAWVQHLLAKGVVPTRIELGNELYFAAFLGGAERFPNSEATLAISQHYVDAIRPLLPAHTKFAVLSAGSRLDGDEPSDFMAEYFAGWDAALEGHNFDATVVHFYPEMISLMNDSFGMADAIGPARAALAGVVRTVSSLDSEATAMQVTEALLARVEQGTRRQVALLDRLTGGKEIWFTEWGVGENIAFYRGENPVVTGAWVQVLARQLQEFLRHPSITQALNHSLYFDGRIWSAMRRVASEEQYVAIGAYDIFRWFGEALDVAEGTVSVHQATIDGATNRVAAVGPGEQFADVTATVLDAGTKRTAFVHNMSGADLSVDLDGIADGSPAIAELIHTPLLRQTFAFGTPPITSLVPNRRAVIPTNSFARFIWNA